LNEAGSRDKTDFGMTGSRDEILAVLRKQEAVLLALLETVQRDIQRIQPDTPRFPTQTTREEGQLMNQVLAALGQQFTSVEIFETAKKLRPGFKRDSLKRAVDWLQAAGVILKIEDGRGRRPARFEKVFKH
jgi:hypothetical protein